MSTYRIATGGLHTECSTFNPLLMQQADFRILRGEAILAHAEFAPLTEFPVNWLPTLHARAVPGGPISRDTYHALKSDFLARLQACLPIDGLYLSMHGAVFVQGMEDAEGDWIAAARDVVGPTIPISASYDLHGNLSQRIIDSLDMVSAYRTAPHIDVDATKRRAIALLLRCLDTGERPFIAWTPIPVLLPGERTSTEDEPARSLYARLAGIEQTPGIQDAALMVGYVWADEPRATACTMMTGTDVTAMARESASLAQAYFDARDSFTFGSVTAGTQDCIAQALAATTAPTILAESGDNPTGGGVGDRADILAALVAHNAQNTLVAGIADRPATMACYQAGIGATIALSIGATLDPAGSAPLQTQAEIIFLAAAGEDSERQAVIRIGGIHVALTARRRPFHTHADFAAIGQDPRKVKLLVVKSGYLSPDLAPIANPSLMALSEGVVDQNVTRAPRHRIPRPTFPFDRDFSYAPRPRLSARAPASARALLEIKP